MKQKQNESENESLTMEDLLKDNLLTTFPCQQYTIGFSALAYYNKQKTNYIMLITIKQSD